jgi:hypothetical protein
MTGRGAGLAGELRCPIALEVIPSKRDCGWRMIPIGTFVERCKVLSQDQFCEQYPHPFLVHSTSIRRLSPKQDSQEITWELVATQPPSSASSEFLGPTVAGTDAKPGRLYSIFMMVPTGQDSSVIAVGSSSECDVHINDRSVSRRHAVINVRGAQYFIKDAGSSSGTRLNDEKLGPDRHPLNNGDTISLGQVDLTFLLPADFYQLVKRLYLD